MLDIYNKRKLWFLFLLGYFVVPGLASLGDRLDEFKRCNEACVTLNGCIDHSEGQTRRDVKDNPYVKYTFYEPPWAYKQFLYWDCESECDYQCQQIITATRIRHEQEILQFHGKWPFRRIFGMQEFFATIFSIGNIVPHWLGFWSLRKELAHSSKSRSKVLLQQYSYVAIVGTIAWTCSAIFHTRDLLITEKLDYFFAGATVLTAFHGILVRVRRLDRNPFARKSCTAVVLLVFLMHIHHLYTDWSYSYNMKFNVFFGALQYLLLIILAIRNRKTVLLRRLASASVSKVYKQQEALMFHLFWKPLLLVCYTALAMTTELNDFFSYSFQLDSHALWHLLTILPSYYLYDFFLRDYRYLSSQTLAAVSE